MKSQQYASPQQFSALTGLSMSTVRRRLRDGSLLAVQPGGFRKGWLIDLAAFRKSCRLDDVGQPSIGDPTAAQVESSDLVSPVPPDNTHPAGALTKLPGEIHRLQGHCGRKPRWMTTDENRSQ